LFSIFIVNFLLQIVTLGLYYPWAKAKTLQYLYGATEFEGSRLQFHGTGKEMFSGFIKALGFIIVIYLFYFFLISQEQILIATVVLLLGIFFILPLAIHGSYRYRMSRTSWRSIRFGYGGDRMELVKLVWKGAFLTIITIGIYGAWFSMNLRNYVMSNIRFGNAQFKYNGKGGDYFVLNLVGYLLTILTLGIYGFWWQKSLFDYYINNLSIESGEQQIQFKSKATGIGFMGLIIVNLLIIIFSLGLATPWAIVRTMNYVFSNIELDGNVDVEQLIQSQENYTDATSEGLADFFDFDLVL
jgi:uncharacterized membrane protein YjgN (DUF898 family)